MNGIEQIKKANELSRVLKEHGLAQDSFEAIKQAHSITNKERSSVLEIDPVNIKQEITYSETQSKSDSQNNKAQNNNGDALKNKLSSLERSKHLLNQRVDDFSKKIDSLYEENKQLKSRLESVEAKIRFISKGSGATSSATNPPVTEAPDPSQSTIQSTSQPRINETTPQNNTRSNTAAQLSSTPLNSSSANSPGNQGVDLNSVSIEKIFYYGTKR